MSSFRHGERAYPFTNEEVATLTGRFGASADAVSRFVAKLCSVDIGTMTYRETDAIATAIAGSFLPVSAGGGGLGKL